MCAIDFPRRRERGLWWAMVSYFRAYPPLVQGEGVGLRGPQARRHAEADTPRVERPRIRIYW